jgi:hypothetical protein
MLKSKTKSDSGQVRKGSESGTRPPANARSGHGWLKHDNSPGDLTKTPRCGARTRRGAACEGPAMANGRCRMHGGLSTGPRTPKGLERSRRARWKHGAYSEEAKHERRRLKAECAASNAAVRALLAMSAPHCLRMTLTKRSSRS